MAKTTLARCHFDRVSLKSEAFSFFNINLFIAIIIVAEVTVSNCLKVSIDGFTAQADGKKQSKTF